MKPNIPLVAAIVSLALVAIARSQDKPATEPYYEETVAASNPLRTEQAKELDAYILAQQRDDTRLRALLTPDYSSPTAYEKSVEAYRKAFCDSIGYPPPGDVPKDAAMLD